MTARHEARAADDLYRSTSTAMPARLLAVGQPARVHGYAGRITAIDYSVATNTRIVTVEVTPRIRLRVAERDVELIEGKA